MTLEDLQTDNKITSPLIGDVLYKAILCYETYTGTISKIDIAAYSAYFQQDDIDVNRDYAITDFSRPRATHIFAQAYANLDDDVQNELYEIFRSDDSNMVVIRFEGYTTDTGVEFVYNINLNQL